jgi:hypothetical protein
MMNSCGAVAAQLFMMGLGKLTEKMTDKKRWT